MSVTVAALYNTICDDLLEPNPPGLTLSMVTQAQVLDWIGEVLMDFLSQADLVRGIFTQQILAGVSQYPVPERMTTVYQVFVDAHIIEQVDLFSQYIMGQWQRQQGPTKAWHADGLPLKVAEIIPAPNWNGAAPNPVPAQPPFGNFETSFEPGNRNLSFVGGLLASKNTWGIGDILDTIPDSLTPYIVFGVLSRVFSMDGEAKDKQRALYCDARYQEGISLARSILLESIDETVMAAGR